MRASYNQKGRERGERKGKKKRGGATFQSPISASRTFHSRNCSSSFFPRYHPVSNYTECTANDASSIPARWRLVKNRSVYWVGGAIYHGKYVRPGPVKGWWFCGGVTSDIRLYAGRGLIKATSITQPDNLCTREKTNDGCLLASIACLTSSSCSFTLELLSLLLFQSSSASFSALLFYYFILLKCDKIHVYTFILLISALPIFKLPLITVKPQLSARLLRYSRMCACLYEGYRSCFALASRGMFELCHRDTQVSKRVR